MLKICADTFEKIEMIITLLRSAQPYDLERLVGAIDIDFNQVNAKIKDAIAK
jgi:hypothetical protein